MLSDAPFPGTVPLFTGAKYTPERPTATIPGAIISDLTTAAATGAFPLGTTFALSCHRHRGALQIRIVAAGLGNHFLFMVDGTPTPESADLHAEIASIASAYNQVSAPDRRQDVTHCRYELEVILETDSQYDRRHRRHLVLAALAILSAVAALTAGLSLILTAPWPTLPAQLGVLALSTILIPTGYVTHMAGRWTAPAPATDPEAAL